MHVEDTDKFNLRSHFRIIKLLSLVREIAKSHYNVHLKTE